MAKREAFYECVLSAERNEYRFHFRAWSAEAAAVALGAELHAYGFTAPGTIEVRDARGRLVARAAYDPGAGAAAS